MRWFGSLLLAAASWAATPSPEWVTRSNENAKLLLAVQAKYAPESAASAGIEGIDEQISDIREGASEKARVDLRQVAAEYRKRLAAEKDANVKQDLEILFQAAESNIRRSEVTERLTVPYFRVAQMVFGSLRSLLDDQIAESRRPAALVRLRKYTGMVEGFRPATEIAMERTRKNLADAHRVTPFRAQVQQDLAQAGFFLDGLAPLFQKYKIAGYEEPLARLRSQVTAYHEFVKNEVMPRARTDFRLPAELYAINLESYGVDIPPADLAKMAHAAFDEIQKEMQAIAAEVAKERGFDNADYRAVIRELKKEQLVGEAILPHYKQRLEQLEAIVRRNDLFTLPARPSRIRLATAAESAQQPAPNMRPPRLLGNTGEAGEFVLPLNIPDATGKSQSYDDFTFAAASWTLTVHEARPGHEMQFAAMVEKGVSTARALYAFNSANVEGWGLYTEAVMKPYLPRDGQLIALQHRLVRAARAFLDPELQSGKVTPAEATRILREDVVLSEAMARQETDRYTFRNPGQATSYFYGFTRLMELRRDVEKTLGPKFRIKQFHDAVLAQGLLPPALLRKAVEQALGAAP